MTLRETIQAKIDGAQATIDGLKNELSATEATFPEWLDKDVVEFKSKVDAFMAKL